jgi:putative tricarboxylic transport membrane protein
MREPSASGRKIFGRELAAGALIAIFGIFYTAETAKIGEGASHAVVPPWAFPLVVGLGLTAVGVLLCVFAVTKAARPASGTEEQPIDWRAAFGAMAVLIAYAAAFAPLGFVLATTVMIPLMARIFGSRSLVRDLVYAVLFSLGFYSVFAYGIGVPLPAGPFAGLF